MSSLTTTKIDTANGATSLTLTTGNTSGPALVIDPTSALSFRTNATFFPITSNNVLTIFNTQTNIANTLGASGNAIFYANASFSANITAANIYATYTESASIKATSNTINIGTPSISTTGWSRMPNGLLWQWGSVSATTTTGDVTFPTTFSTLYSVTATTVSTVTGSTYAALLISANVTTAVIRTSNANSRTVYWQAIGV